MRWMWLAVMAGCGGASDDGVEGPAPTDTDTAVVGTRDTTSTPTDTASPPLTADTHGTPTADTGSTPVRIDAVQVVDGGLPLLRALDITLSGPAPVAAVCRDPADADERLLFEGDGASARHHLELPGLLADTDYDCTVGVVENLGGSGTAATTVGVRPPGLPSSLPTFTVTGSGAVSDAWVLFNHQFGCGANGPQWAVLADRQGRIRWAYQIGRGFDIDIDMGWAGDRFHFGGGWALFDESEPHRGLFRQVRLDGTVVAERTEPLFGLGFNHHSEVLDDGQVLSLTTHAHVMGAERRYGVAAELWDPTTDAVAWSWDTEQAVANGQLPPPASESPWHANAVEWVTDAHGDALWVSLYTGQEMWRVDRVTGDITHLLAYDGDMQLLDATGVPAPASQWFYGQHDPDVTEDGLVVLYDNGVGRPGGSQSRIAAFQLDLDARTATALWSWTEEGWYTPFVGDADLLPDGHVLATKGVIQCTTPWLTDEHSAVIELDPAAPGGPEPVWRMTWDDRDGQVFRAERYDGCEILQHGGMCGDVADRIDQLGL